MSRRDQAQLLLYCQLSLHFYLLGEPENPVVVWKKLSDQLKKNNMGKQIGVTMKVSFAKVESYKGL